MALNPKLNVYVVTLNPKDKDSNPTFRMKQEPVPVVVKQFDKRTSNHHYVSWERKLGIYSTRY